MKFTHNELNGGYADGWYCLGPASAFSQRTAHELEIFGSEYLLIKSKEFEISVIERFCPHMGARLPAALSFDQLVCPFHEWKWAPSGICVDVPGLDSPPRIRIPKLETITRGGLVFVRPPSTDSPSRNLRKVGPEGFLKTLEDGVWWGPVWEDFGTFDIVQLDLIENVVDRQHFQSIHEVTPRAFRIVSSEDFIGHIMVSTPAQNSAIYQDSVSSLTTRALYYGPGVLYDEVRTIIGGVTMRAKFIVANLPISQRRTSLSVGVWFEPLKGWSDDFCKSMAGQYLSGVRQGLMQDMPVWESRRRPDRPKLSKIDGPIYDARRWYRGHFEGNSVQ